MQFLRILSSMGPGVGVFRSTHLSYLTIYELGPIYKSYPFHYIKIHSLLIDALEELGVPRNPEPVCSLRSCFRPLSFIGMLQYGGDMTGTFTCYTSIDPRTTTRSYSASGYYEPNSNRDNLKVLLRAHVVKVRCCDLFTTTPYSYVRRLSLKTGPANSKLL